MMNLRVIPSALVLAGTVALPGTASADQYPPFRPFSSWVSSMNATCVDPACLEVAFTLDLNWVQQTGTAGALGGLGGSGGDRGYLFAGAPTSSATVKPEPLSMTLLATGLVGLTLVTRRRKKR